MFFCASPEVPVRPDSCIINVKDNDCAVAVAALRCRGFVRLEEDPDLADFSLLTTPTEPPKKRNNRVDDVPACRGVGGYFGCMRYRGLFVCLTAVDAARTQPRLESSVPQPSPPFAGAAQLYAPMPDSHAHGHSIMAAVLRAS